MFEIVEVRFFLVGHTNEYIDVTYGRLLEKIMSWDIFSFSQIMDTYRTCEDQNFYVPYLIDEFYDFKSFVKPHLLVGNVVNISIKKCRLFKFQLIDNILVMQCRASLWDEKRSTHIHLWRSLLDGSTNLLVGNLNYYIYK